VPTPRGEEDRFLSIGLIEGKIFAVVWTWRDDAVRIITARRREMRKKAVPCGIRLNRSETRLRERRPDELAKVNATTGAKLEASIRADSDDIHSEPTGH